MQSREYSFRRREMLSSVNRGGNIIISPANQHQRKCHPWACVRRKCLKVSARRNQIAQHRARNQARNENESENHLLWPREMYRIIAIRDAAPSVRAVCDRSSSRSISSQRGNLCLGIGNTAALMGVRSSNNSKAGASSKRAGIVAWPTRKASLRACADAHRYRALSERDVWPKA